MSTEIALRATINEIEGHRNRAIELFGRAHDLMEEAISCVGKAAPNANHPLFDHDRWGSVAWSGGKDRDEFLSKLKQRIDINVWTHLIDHMGFEKLMDHQAREEFRRTLRENPPEATAENCAATMAQLMSDADLIFRRGVANAFSKLDRRFRSHDGFKIGARIVLSHCFSEYGSWGGNRDEIMRDVERTFRLLDGKEHIDRYAGIVGKCSEAKRHSSLKFQGFEVEDDYFRVRAFKNGNAHMWFKRRDLVQRVNELLAEYYGATVGASPDVAETRSAPLPVVREHWALFETPERLAKLLVANARVEKGMRCLEPSAGRGRILRELQAAGGDCTAVEIDPANWRELPEAITLPGDFLSMGEHALGRFDRIVMNPPFNGGRDVDHVNHALDLLKPGGVLVAVMSAGVEFREDSRTTALRQRVERLEGVFTDLPPGSFAESGTNVNAVVLIVGPGGTYGRHFDHYAR
ncbi:MAG: DUF4942 domain-containing protein [Hyphomonadaceae bacterium]|nr:DUF4942 domain-containing protein [Hyphomonadaceae bacterium]